ncbi:MAG: phospholipase D-like domain-containing protein [Chloroflexota bacterium]
MIKQTPLLLLTLLLLLITRPTSAAHAPSPLVYFTDNTDPIGIKPEITPMEQALLAQLNAAESSIDVAIYDFNRDSIRDALIAAHERGVAVRVAADDEARHHIASYIPYYEALEDAGIPIVDDEREGSIMHNKYILIDGRLLWTGSTNMTNNGFTKNHNNSVFFDSEGLVDIYEHDFDAMFVDGKFSKGKDPSPVTSFDYNGIPLGVYFSPEDGGVSALIERVNAATSTIDFAIFFFTDDNLRDALIAAHERGVVVRGIWDLLGGSSPFSDDEALCNAGIPIKTENFVGKMHNKLMVIDSHAADPVVVTGSMNWTRSGDNSNDENTLIIHDRETAVSFQQAFDELHAVLPSETQCDVPPPETAATVYLPLVVRDRTEAVPPPPAAAKIELATIVYNPDGSDVEGEYIEIRNVGNAAQKMTEWGLSDESATTFIFPNFTLADGASVRIWVKAGTNTSTDLYWGRSSSVWNNGGDSAILTDAAGDVVDVCAYEGGEETAVCD